MKVLVTAASRYGATAEIAEALADALRENGVGAAAVAPADVTSLASYDAVVLGSGVYAGRWLPPARDLAHRLAGELTDRPVWLFSSGPVGGRPKPPAIPTDAEPMMALTGAREHRVFAGRLSRARMGRSGRFLAALLRVRDTDERDWTAIGDWGRRIAQELLRAPAGAPHERAAR